MTASSLRTARAATLSAGIGAGALDTVLATALGRSVPAAALDYRGGVSVKDARFGAVGDGVTDDSTAIEAAIAFVSRFVTAFPELKGGVELWFPEGDYRITRSVLSYRTAVQLKGPIRYRGVGAATSRILLDPPSAAATWMYDSLTASGAIGVTSKFEHLTFEDLGFLSMGSNPTFANGFRYASSGHEKGFQFIRCFFGEGASGLAQAVYATGNSANADQLVFDRCRVRTITDAFLVLNNSQSVGIDFYGCNALGFNCDLIRVLDGSNSEGNGGGGRLRWHGGSINFKNADPGTPVYVLNLAGSNNLNHTYEISPDQCELYNTNQRFLVKTAATGAAIVTCNGVPFDSNPTVGSDFNFVDIAENVTVDFNGCIIRQDMKFNISNSAGSSGWARSEPGSVRFWKCRYPYQTILNHLYVGGSLIASNNQQYGHFKATDCQINNASSLNGSFGTYFSGYGDIDWGWQNQSGGGHATRRKLIAVKTQAAAWGTTTTGWIVVVPPYSQITGFLASKPASGTDTTSYQITFGTLDRTTTYAQASAGQFKDAQSLDSALGVASWIDVGTSANKYCVRMWNGSGATPAQSITGGIAFVEYI